MRSGAQSLPLDLLLSSSSLNLRQALIIYNQSRQATRQQLSVLWASVPWVQGFRMLPSSITVTLNVENCINQRRRGIGNVHFNARVWRCGRQRVFSRSAADLYALLTVPSTAHILRPMLITTRYKLFPVDKGLVRTVTNDIKEPRDCGKL